MELASLRTLVLRTEAEGLPDLYVPQRGFIEVNSEGVSVPKHSVEREGETVHVAFDVNSLKEGTGSSIRTSPETTITVEASTNFIHDFTFHHLEPATDFKFSKFFERVNDDFDNYTPDVILPDMHGRYAIVEFATCRRSDYKAMVAVYENKIGKYYPACKSRAKSSKRITLFCLVVSDDKIITNLELNDIDARELCLRFNTAVDVYAYLTEKGVVPMLMDGDTTSSGSSVQLAFQDIQFRWDVTEEKFKPFSEEMYNGWCESQDKAYVKAMINKCLDKTNDLLAQEHMVTSDMSKAEKLTANFLRTCQSIEDYEKKFFKPGKMRGHKSQKSTIPIPAIVPKLCPEPNIELKAAVKKRTDFPETRDAVGKLWHEVMTMIARGKTSRMSEDRETEERFLSGDISKDEEHTAKALRSSFHRVKTKLNSEDAAELAQLGIEGKRYRNDPSVKLNRQEKKKGFPLETDLSGIEYFLNENKALFIEPDVYELPAFLERILYANENALYAHGFKNAPLPIARNIEEFWKSPLMRWAFMVTCIGVELAIANKQHCNGGEFIVKKLRDYDVFLLMKPTNSTGPMFVSLAWHESDVDGMLSSTGVFKKFNAKNGWYYTDFHSFKAAKVSTLVKTASRMNNLNWFWREQYNIKPWEQLPDGEASINVCKMLKISLMCMLEDKARTEELFTNFRYILLEGFVSDPCLPKPAKMVEKLPDIARTHLQVWLIRHQISAMRRVAQAPWTAEAVEGKMIWKDLWNPFTGTKVEDPCRLINLFYLGYLKNKDEPAEKNAAPALVRKIVKLEDQHPGRYEYLGYADPPLDDIRTHEYSVSFQKHVCNVALRLLKATWGENVEQTIHVDILNEFGNLTLDRVSTLKASSAFDETWYTSDGSQKYHRVKVVENFQKFITPEHTHVHHVLRQCLETIEDRGCMHIDIFKKNQHGGLREIYVLGPEERIVQLALETIAKKVCKRFKSETLTNPSSKTKIPESHGKRARACQERDVVNMKFETIGTSDDLKTFNQTQHTTKLALTLVKFTKKELHPFIIRACSLFMKKRIKLDDDLLDIIIKNHQLETDDDVLRTLHGAYRGTISPPPRWAKEGLSFIETETGMMQGILHFLSSLQHTCLQEWYRVYCYYALLSVIGKHSKGVVVDVMQSSDDSAVLISYPVINADLLKKCRLAGAQMLYFKKFLGEFLGLYPSIKCTTNTLNVMEFNSEFFFHNDHVRPTLKWVIASDQISEQEAIVSRQEEMSSALTGIIEGGGSISLCHTCQYGQSILHYTLLGAGTSFLFDKFLIEANKFKDPSLGFFLMDHPFGAGLTGFKYNLWNQVRGSNLGAIYKMFLTAVKEDIPPTEKERVYRSLETTTCGALASSVTIRYGNREHWKALKSRCDIPEDWESRIDEDAEMLYRQAKTTEEVKLKIAEKLHAPGVSASLSRGDQVVKMISSSIYILSRNVVCQGTSWMESKPDVLLTKKPLLRLIMEQNKIPLEGIQQIDDHELKILFPMHEEYCHLKDILGDHMVIDGGPVLGRRKTVQTRVVVIQKEDMARVSPEDILTDIWFSFRRSGLTSPVLWRTFESMKKHIPWLRPTVEETLECSPFLHQHQLRNFIARMGYDGRVVKLVGAPLKAKIETNVATVITKNFFPQWELSMSYDLKAWQKSRHANALKHFCTLLCAGPYKDWRKYAIFDEVMKGFPKLQITAGAGKSRTNTLALLQEYSRIKNDDVVLFHRNMRSANCGIIGGFSRAQNARSVGSKVEYEGLGIWEGTVDGHPVEIHIDTVDGITQLKRVEVQSEEFARLHLCPFIRSWCADMNVHNTHRYRGHGASLVLIKFGLRSYGTGCPVYISPSKVVGRDIPYREMQLNIEGSNISLIHFPGGGRRCKILSYRCRSADVHQESAEAFFEFAYRLPVMRSEPTVSWMRLMSLNHATLMKHKRKFMEDESMGGIDKQRYREIIADSAICIMNMKGYTLHDLSPATLSKAEAESALDLMWNYDVMDSMGDLISEGLVAAIAEGPEGLENETDGSRPEWVDASAGSFGSIPELNMTRLQIEDAIDVNVFGEPEFPAAPKVQFRHPALVADTVEHIIRDNLTALDITTLLEKRTITRDKLAHAEELMWLLNKDAERIQVVTQREDTWDVPFAVSDAVLDDDTIG
uniref:RNA-directed RNA polymerase L n=1 Tax=Bangxi Phenu tick virus 1 TaxID=2972301 RepID=A0A9E8AD89_9VIRU|nr:MAG: RNA-dependent RNA polymerase [Bangxi Phenu tick virus 1]